MSTLIGCSEPDTSSVVNYETSLDVEQLMHYVLEPAADIVWDSAGTIGFKGTRKATPFAATRAGETVGAKVRKMGMHEVEVRITGTGAGREAAINGVVSTGIRVTAIEDHTPVPHNGCRPKKKRRV